MPLELVIDSFAGGGGASTGIRAALGRDPDHAVNHDPIALAIHEANHPGSKHWTTDLQGLHPLTVTAGRPVGLLWASPDCTDHSKAKGGVPRRKTIRDLAWVVVLWAKAAKPRVIILENVEEFRQWGPLLPDGRPDPAARGQEFDRWVDSLRATGYRVEWRELRACDYGTPTTRKRLFLIARRDRQPIVWPEPTHGPGKLPYRTAAECIDWSIPVRSIFDRARPLAPATCRRIARGVRRYVLEAARPFLVPYYGGDERVHGVDDPLRTQTTENRFGLVVPSVMTNTSGHPGRAVDEPLPTVTTGGQQTIVSATIVGCGGRAGQSRPRGVDEPMATTTSKADACVVAPFLAPRYGERPGQDPRCLPADAPMPTVVPTGNGGSLVAAFMAQHNGGATGHPATEPLSTLTGRATQQQVVAANLLHLRNNCDGRPVDEPLPTITADGLHHGDVRTNLSTGPDFGRAQQVAAFLSAYYGTDQSGNLEAPLATATTVDRFAVVTVTIEGVEYVLTDIGMRMLEPAELYRAQGFPSDYIIAPLYQGKPLSKTAQVRACGNSVCPPMAEALVRANVVLRDVPEAPPMGGLFAEVV